MKPARPEEILPLLRDWHIRSLRHVSTMLLFGWENRRDTDRELEELGLIQGEWTGSLEYRARPMWTITRLGEQVLRLVDASREAVP